MSSHRYSLTGKRFFHLLAEICHFEVTQGHAWDQCKSSGFALHACDPWSAFLTIFLISCLITPHCYHGVEVFLWVGLGHSLHSWRFKKNLFWSLFLNLNIQVACAEPRHWSQDWMSTSISSLRRGCIGSSGYPRQRSLGGFTPAPWQWLCCLNLHRCVYVHACVCVIGYVEGRGFWQLDLSGCVISTITGVSVFIMCV